MIFSPAADPEVDGYEKSTNVVIQNLAETNNNNNNQAVNDNLQNYGNNDNQLPEDICLAKLDVSLIPISWGQGVYYCYLNSTAW